MSEAATPVNPPPGTITEAPFMLDDVLFTPDRIFERASREGELIGELVLDDNRFWFARKPAGQGEWQPMRCVHEARAFLVRIRS